MIIGYIIYNNPFKLLKSRYPLLEMEELLKRGHSVIPIPVGYEEAYSNLIKRCDFIIIHKLNNANRISKYKIPYGVIFHGAHETKMRVARNIDRMPDCKWIGYITEHNKSLLEKWGIKKKLVYTPNAARTELFKREKVLGDKIIGGGRWIQSKQYELILRAEPNAYIFGDGNDVQYKNKLYNEFPNANFTGWLNGNQIKDLYEDSWLFVSPSIHAGESAPKTVMEAMLMEMQVLVTPKGGTKEFEGSHFLSENPTPEEIKEKIKDIPKERNIIGREWVLKNHTIDIFIDNILDAIINE